MNTTLIICTSCDCPIKNECSRYIRSDPDDIDQTAYNFQYNGCDLSNGFPDHIKDNI